MNDHTPDRLRVAVVRRDVHAYLADELGAREHIRGRWHDYTFTADGPSVSARRRTLRVTVTVNGSASSFVEVERWNTADAPSDARAWLEEHVWPYVQRWCTRTGRGATLPAGGSWDCAAVQTGELLDLLRMWVPQEVAWQRAASVDALAAEAERQRIAARAREALARLSPADMPPPLPPAVGAGFAARWRRGWGGAA